MINFAIKREHFAQSVAAGTHPLRTVEAEHLRCRRRKTDSTGGTGIIGGVNAIAVDLRLDPFGFVDFRLAFSESPASGFDRGRVGVRIGGNDQRALSDFQCRLDRFGQSRANPGFGGNPINDHFDVVTFGAIEVDFRAQRNDVAVDASANKTFFEQVGEQIAMFAFLSPDDRARAPNTGYPEPSAECCQ